MFESVADNTLHPRLVGAGGGRRATTIAVTPIAQPSSLATMLVNADQMHRANTPATGTLTGAISMMSSAAMSVTPFAPLIARAPQYDDSGRQSTRSMISGANSTPSGTTTTVTTTTTTTDNTTNITTTTVTTTTRTTTNKTIPRHVVATAAAAAAVPKSSNRPPTTSSSSSASSGESRSGFQGVSYFHRGQVRKMLAAGTTIEHIAKTFETRYTLAELQHLVRYYNARKQLDESEMATVVEMRRIGASWATVARHFERDVLFVRAALRMYEESLQRPWSDLESRKLMETIAHTQPNTAAFWPTVTQRMKCGRHRFAPRDALTTKQHYEKLQEQSQNDESSSGDDDSEFIVRKNQD